MSRSCLRKCFCSSTEAVRSPQSSSDRSLCRLSFILKPAAPSSPDDPVCMFKHTPPAPHSVLKFLQDVFASRETADIFYSTDMMVMIDIAVRQISDLSPGDKVRNQRNRQLLIFFADFVEEAYPVAELGEEPRVSDTSAIHWSHQHV